MNTLQDDLLGPGVELIETHTAWVFRGDTTVYKVKKPVNYGFLDYSSVEKRRAACEAEIELNRRLARDVYLAAVPITRDARGAHAAEGDGDVVDWAVKMTRLDDGDRADFWLRDGTLRREHIDAIAEYLAAFHERMPTNDHIASFGAPDRILANVRENFTQTRGLVEEHLTPQEAAEIEAGQTHFFETHRELLEQRVREGRVRDGHGDLRLEHVYLRPGKAPTIIDCIEFNERFRYADVASDLAFLSMDLERLGRADFAERLLSTYARASSDFGLFRLVDAYQGYRAYVRGKVASFLASDSGAATAVRDAAARNARRSYLLALAEGRKALLAPALVAVGGVIASGKSTVAEEVSRLTSAPVVDADRTRKALLGVECTEKLHDPAWSGAYSDEMTQRTYGEVLRRAESVLASGRPVVIDASFRSGEFRGKARELAARFGVPFFFVECRVSRDECAARLAVRERTRSVSDGRREILDAFIARWEPPGDGELGPGEHVVLDTSLPVTENLEKLRDILPVWPAGLNG